MSTGSGDQRELPNWTSTETCTKLLTGWALLDMANNPAAIFEELGSDHRRGAVLLTMRAIDAALTKARAERVAVSSEALAGALSMVLADLLAMAAERGLVPRDQVEALQSALDDAIHGRGQSWLQ